MTDASGNRPPRRVVLDAAIVASFLLLPQSYLLFLSSSEFGASLLTRAPIFLAPALLLVVRLARPHPSRPSFVDPVVVFLWLAVMVQGLTMGLIHTQHPGNVLSNYGQYFYWLALVAAFLGCVAEESGLYVLDLVRRYFLAVSAVAWVFVAMFLVFGAQLPHHSVMMPDPAGGDIVLAQNYYFTVAYSGHSLLGTDVPRFTFLYREPRTLGVQLAIGLILQIGHLRGHWGSWSRSERWQGLTGMGLLGGALFWTHSLHGYIFATFVAITLGVAWVLRERFWRSFRAIHLGIIAAGVTFLIIAFAALGRRSDLQALVESIVAQRYVGDPDVSSTTLYGVVGKGPAFIAGYLAAYLSSPRGLLLFPLGTGMMNLDNERFLHEYGVPTSGGATLVQVFAQNAGFVGLVAFGVILWRLLGYMRRLALATRESEVRYACLLGGFLLVVSTVYLDIISLSAFAPLIFGATMHLRSET